MDERGSPCGTPILGENDWDRDVPDLILRERLDRRNWISLTNFPGTPRSCNFFDS